VVLFGTIFVWYSPTSPPWPCTCADAAEAIDGKVAHAAEVAQAAQIETFACPKTVFILKLPYSLELEPLLVMESPTLRQINPEPEQKPLPMKTIGLAIAGLFALLALGFLVIPAFFDKNPFGGKLFEDGPAPWAVSEAEQQKFQFTDDQKKGRYHFQQYCSSCHGPDGRGNGPSSMTLNKRPPNFIADASGYVNGLSKQGVLKTLEEGIAGSQMASYSNLPPETKNQLAEFIVYLNKHPSLF
jgi:mono/diheme cytochrome c family protein